MLDGPMTNPYAPPETEGYTDAELQRIQRGRAVTIAISVGTVAIALIVEVGGGGSGTGAVRFVLTGLLAYFLFRGHAWARVLGFLLYGFAALMGVVMFRMPQGFWSALLSVMTLFYGWSAYALAASPSVKAFLAVQRRAV